MAGDEEEQTPAPAPEELGAVEQIQRAGETWRFAREGLSDLPPHALHALAAREHLPVTAELVERLADEAE